MSTFVMAACWPLILPPVSKNVLISLADNANDHGVCWPSIATICRRTCYGRTAVIEAIAELERRGYLTGDRTNGRHTSYTIHVAQKSLDLPESYPQPVRQTDRSATRTGPPRGHYQSATRTAPVRHADTNRKEPSITVITEAANKFATEAKAPSRHKSTDRTARMIAEQREARKKITSNVGEKIIEAMQKAGLHR